MDKRKRSDSGVFFGTSATATDRLFVYFIKAVFVIFLLYGAGMVVVILWGPGSIAVKMVTAFSTMFTGLLGLGGGYLLGKRTNGAS